MSIISNTLVSIITAFYREEKFLDETIQSVLAQTHTNWELLLVDDGSTDGSMEIAKRYASMHPDRIFYLQHENRANKGVCQSRNLGISRSKGEYITYLDADDVWLPEKLEKQLRIFAQHRDATVLLEASTYWYSWENPERHDVVIEVGITQNKTYYPPQLILDLYPLGKGAAPCPSGIMVKRKIHDHIRFVEDFIGPTAVYEDQAFLAQIYLKENVYISSQSNNLYRQREASQVYNVHNDGRYEKVRLFYLDWFKAYLEKQNIKNSAINWLLWKAYMPYHQPSLYKVWHALATVKWRLKNLLKS